MHNWSTFAQLGFEYVSLWSHMNWSKCHWYSSAKIFRNSSSNVFCDDTFAISSFQNYFKVEFTNVCQVDVDAFDHFLEWACLHFQKPLTPRVPLCTVQCTIFVMMKTLVILELNWMQSLKHKKCVINIFSRHKIYIFFVVNAYIALNWTQCLGARNNKICNFLEHEICMYFTQFSHYFNAIIAE